MKNHKYIFVTGGVMSGVGKGIAASSIGAIFKARGFAVTMIKIDPYVNVDAGTMNPTEHGEVFVLEDGDECDQDMGNYERFLNISLTRTNYMTTGRVYQAVINRERNLEYGGEDVEVYPDIPKEIIRRIKACQEKNESEITIIEYGGTVGEYQLLPFLEATRMMKSENPSDVFVVLISYLPTPTLLGEQKSNSQNDNSHQFYSAAHINNLGILSVGFYDSDPSYKDYTYYMIAHSYDGGDSFTKAVNSSTLPTYFGSVGARNSSFGVGEYNATLMSSSYAIPFWADGRLNEGSLKIYFRKMGLDKFSDIPVVAAVNADFRIVELIQNKQANNFNLTIYSDNEQTLKFEIYDILGNLYKTYSLSVNSGNTQVNLDADNLMVGVYLLRVSNPNFFTTDKLIVK